MIELSVSSVTMEKAYCLRQDIHKVKPFKSEVAYKMAKRILRRIHPDDVDMKTDVYGEYLPESPLSYTDGFRYFEFDMTGFVQEAQTKAGANLYDGRAETIFRMSVLSLLFQLIKASELKPAVQLMTIHSGEVRTDDGLITTRGPVLSIIFSELDTDTADDLTAFCYDYIINHGYIPIDAMIGEPQMLGNCVRFPDAPTSKLYKAPRTLYAVDTNLVDTDATPPFDIGAYVERGLDLPAE